MGSPLDIPVQGEVKVLISGVWDLFHYGHAEAISRAKSLFPRTTLVVGIHSDAVVRQKKGRVVMRYEERKAILAHLKWVDRILDNAPWAPTAECLDQYNVDYVAGNSTSVESDEDVYCYVKAAGRFIEIPRVVGISSTLILERVIRNYDSHLRRDEPRSASSMESLGRSSSRWWERLRSEAMANANLRVGSYIRFFGEHLLHNWNIMAAVRGASMLTRQQRVITYPDKQATPSNEDESIEELVPLATTVCKQYVPGWKGVSPDMIKIMPVTGGLTNRLYKISLRPEAGPMPSLASAPTQVLLRLYGRNTDLFFNRENEHIIFKTFSDAEIGPRLYGFFDGGQLEEFLSLKTAKEEDMIRLTPIIARKIASMHAMTVPGIRQAPRLFDSMINWLKIAQGMIYPSDAHTQGVLGRIGLNGRLPEQVGELLNALGKIESDVVFCHNDILAGNILYHEENEENLVLIDYEYGSYNFRAFDLGNHFGERTINYGANESSDFQINPEWYPDIEEQRRFIKCYAERWEVLTGKRIDTEGLRIEANAFGLASHVLWSLWALIQSISSEISFRYLDFAESRIAIYDHFKDEFLGELKDWVEKNAGMKSERPMDSVWWEPNEKCEGDPLPDSPR